jgi:LPXTG-site transpeptidase (sortase) family protein
MNITHAWRWGERALVVLGAGCLLWVAAAEYQTARYRRSMEQVLAPLAAASHPAAATPDTPRRLEGLLEIPRLHAIEAMAEGDDDETLAVAVGHLPDTAMPWEKGNTALAGHRDTLFRALRQIENGDAIVLHTVRGEFRYHVTRTMIIDPADIWVLGPTPSPQLTLVTCYPFTFIGHAPHRFIVVAIPDGEDHDRQ